MNRKDTILVAVLINAGVLVVLFTSALKNKSSQDLMVKEMQSSSPMIETRVEPIMLPREEIDIAIEAEKKNQAMLPEGVQFVQDLAIEPKPIEPRVAEGTNVAHEESSVIEVQVKKGDFLAKIAKKYQTSVEEIMKMNQLKNANLRVGQVLKVPSQVHSGSAASIAAVVVPREEVTTGYKTYVVKSGDNPWTIAHKHKMKVEELLKINQLSPEKAKRLKVGDKLKVKA